MEWMKTFERVQEIEKQLIWPTVLEMDSKAFIPEVNAMVEVGKPCDISASSNKK